MSSGRRSPILWVIAAPASVAVWSGWIGLGEKAGWNDVQPLPGIADGFTFPSALLLPIGVEAYGLYAMSRWLSPHTPARARRFAGWSALGSLLIGAAGQVCYHLLAAQDRAVAPDWVVVAVASLPVAVLGMAGLLAHLCAVGPVQDEVRSMPGQAGPVEVDHPVRDHSGPAEQTTGPTSADHPDQAGPVQPVRRSTTPRTTRTVNRVRTGPDQADRTRSDADLIEQIRALIAAGDLAPAPSATRLTAHLGIGKSRALRLAPQISAVPEAAEPPTTAVAG